MTDKKTGGPAFPTTPENEERFNGAGGKGMTLRDYFAAKAMQGLCAHHELGHNPYTMIANAAYLQADAMLEAREK